MHGWGLYVSMCQKVRNHSGSHALFLYKKLDYPYSIKSLQSFPSFLKLKLKLVQIFYDRPKMMPKNDALFRIDFPHRFKVPYMVGF